MNKTISYVMNTIVGEITNTSEFMSIVSDYDYCQFGIDKGDDKQQLKGLLSAMYIEDEITDMIENNIDTARYYAARELFYEWVENL